MYPMDKLSALMWNRIVQRAKQGEKEMMERLQAENRIRKEYNQPTVEEEMEMIVGGDLKKHN